MMMMMMIKVCIIVTICRHFPLLIWPRLVSSNQALLFNPRSDLNAHVFLNTWKIVEMCGRSVSLNSTFPWKNVENKKSVAVTVLHAVCTQQQQQCSAAMMRGGKNTFQKYRSIKSMTGGGRRGALAVRSTAGFMASCCLNETVMP